MRAFRFNLMVIILFLFVLINVGLSQGLHGQIVDQYGNPVERALVSGLIVTKDTVPVASQHLSKETDAKGLFELPADAIRFKLESIQKQGYIFDLQIYQKKLSFIDLLPFKNSQDPNVPAPLTFILIKDEPVDLVMNQFNWSWENLKVADKTIDLLKECQLIPHDLMTTPQQPNNTNVKNQFEPAIDFIFSGKISLARQLELLFTATDKTSGIVLMKEKRYGAPEKGYQPSITLNLDPDSKAEQVYYLYLKTRQGKQYSRLQINYLSGRTPSEIEIQSLSIILPKNWTKKQPFLDGFVS